MEIYSVTRDAWRQGPDLNIPRHSHSSVVVGGKIYVFAGFNGYTSGHSLADPINEFQLEPNGYLNSIESFDARSFLSGNRTKWVLAPSHLNTRQPRINPLVAFQGLHADGTKLIAFFGGYESSGSFAADGFVFKPEEDKRKIKKIRHKRTVSKVNRLMAIAFRYGGSANN